jgi:hypothetical protein
MSAESANPPGRLVRVALVRLLPIAHAFRVTQRPCLRRRHIAVHFAALAALAVLSACAKTSTSTAAGVADTTPPATTATTTPPAEPSSVKPTTSPIPLPSPSPSWTPCDSSSLGYDESGLPDDHACKDLFEDTCDGAYSASQEGRGSLIDLFIENDYEVKPARLKDCPQFLDEWNAAKTGFEEGSQEIGMDVRAGRYSSNGSVSDCYWERTGSSGKILANDFVTVAKKITVTIHLSDEFFTSRGCGNWIRA